MPKVDINILKNINSEQIVEFFKNRIDISVNILLIAVMIYVTIYIYTGNKKKLVDLQQQVAQTSEKLSVTQDIEAMQNKHDSFIQRFPKPIESDQISSKLSAFAADHNVQILSFSPAETKSDEYIELTRVNMRIASDNYDEIVSFVQSIENSSLALNVESWSGALNDPQGGYSQRRKSQETGSENLITADIKIGSIQLK